MTILISNAMSIVTPETPFEPVLTADQYWPQQDMNATVSAQSMLMWPFPPCSYHANSVIAPSGCYHIFYETVLNWKTLFKVEDQLKP